MNENYRKLTNEVGAPVADNENSITAGPRGPVMMQDVWLLEKLAHFDREVIPERRMHAKGWGAYGKFTVTHDITQYTKAKVFSEIGKETEVFVRFSTVAGERGAADAERDIRGVAIKFYTEEGNWDLVGNNTPTFFIRDVHNFPDLNRAVKRDPYTGMRNPQNNWDFWTLLPECFHQLTVVMSDRGIPDGFRHMHLYGEHTFSFYNEKNERVWCKFHFKTQQGIKNLTDEEAEAINGKDRESAGHDLFDAILRGDYPKWTMYVQIMTEEQAKNHYENPFDITKIWRHAEFPLIEVGELELNRWPENYFAEVEQAAFTPAHVVPGIGFSPDKFLQGRLFVYGDAQRYRLGVNHNLIPVNQAKGVKNGVADYHRDGAMRTDGNYGSAPAYSPNSLGVWTAQPEVMEPPLDLEGAMWNYDPKDDPTNDDFRAGGDLWRVMTEDKKELLIKNTAANIAPVTENIKYRHAVHCYLADPEYGECATKAMGLDLDRVKELSKLSNSELNRVTTP
ncbi:catalase [Faecalicatena sp. AGMB00832]|uniref:Catalase n=1 Tax=Faecalicatena faecalis TaxID=2726362 RepID=A0ABS6D1E2_9FIRM|nr:MULTISPECIES: catalase [Faecalicatena]MBU3875310.1 catalase [Faecalicatena faecalis]MCI6467946.1 catalase [Faecalicatena sp.]MDY5619412.1 catalase [Lachnospiraceae bacterium]